VYSINAACDFGFERVVVSTDDPEIAKIAIQNGAEVHAREPEWAADDVGTQEVAKVVLEDLGIINGLACVIYATAPMIRVYDLAKAYEVLLNQAQINYSYSVGPDQVTDAGQFYFGRVQAFLNSEPLTEKSRVVPLPENIVIDINTPDDWKRAEKMYEELHK
jgi:CMP-N-acetylneuraminic acid synthetase